jgi:hypothetical protein
VPHFDIHPGWRDVLGRVLGEAAQHGPGGIVAFDLDSTLLDNRPRQAALLHRFLRERGGPAALAGFEARHLRTGFDMRQALGRAGLGPSEVEAFLVEFRPFWRTHFFTSDACLADVPIRGAPEYVRRVAGTGAQVGYVTARPEEMRPGTLATLDGHGFPAPGGRVKLWMKADAQATDDDFKRSVHQQLGKHGRVLAAFDNEPGHANDYRASFPEATVVLVATGDSGRVSTLAERIPAIPHFDITSAASEGLIAS